MRTEKDMKLTNLMGRNIFELSGGEKQQIACGSVYTADPVVFVLDEPSSNLDRKAINRLHDMLKKMKANGKTIIISEHRLYYLMDIADRFVYLDDGMIADIFSPVELSDMSDSELAGKGLRCTDITRLKKSSGKAVSANSTVPAVETVDLSCTKGGEQILDIERLRLPANGIIAVIGDNGSG